MTNTHAERWWFGALSLTVFSYVLMRAAKVPLVHDEATSFLAYAQTGHFLPFASMWDANNHFLNSLCGWVGYKLFGLHLLALRWASVMAYLLFAWSLWRLGHELKHRAIKWCCWLALLLCPFLLDFFSLFRGYGPAIAFLLFALQAFMRFINEGRRAQLVGVLLGLAIASGFLLALVPLWAVMLFLLLGLVRRERDHLLLCLGLGALPLLVGAGISIMLARFGLLYHGSTDGFVHVTVGSLSLRVLGSSAWPVTMAVLLLAVASLVIVTFRSWRDRNFRSPAFLIAMLLVCETGSRVILAWFFDINYAEDRAALHTLVLSVLLFAFALDALGGKLVCRAMAMALLVLPVRSLQGLNMDHTAYWPEQSIPDRFVGRVRGLEKTLGRPVVVGTHRHAGLPWSLQCRMLGWESDANAHSWPDGMDDVRIVVPFLLGEATQDFSVVDSAPGNHLYLLLRDPPLRTVEVLDTAFAITGPGTVRSLPIPLPVGALRKGDLFVEVRGLLRAEVVPLELRLVVAVTDSAGTGLQGDLVFLDTRREEWNEEPWCTIRHLPGQPNAARAELFFWSPDSAAYQVDGGRLVVRSVEP